MADSIDWQTRCLEAETELQEYQLTSGEFEAELEKELQEKEKELEILKQKYQQLQYDTSNTITRQTTQISEFTKTISVQEKQIKTLSETSNEQSIRLRKFEQEIDDLQKVERQGLASIGSLEQQLAVQIEKNAFLESDLEEKSRGLEAECQRLKDLNRDVLLDLAVQKKNVLAAEPPVSPRQVLSDFQENCLIPKNSNMSSPNYRFPSPIPAGPLTTNNYSSVSSSPDCIKNSSTTTTVNSENSVNPGDAGYQQQKVQQKSNRGKQPMFFSKIFTTLKRSTSFKRSKRPTTNRTNTDNEK